MTKLSKHFKRSEFACSCGCGTSTVDAELITVLEDVREHFGRPVKINSGHRCVENNKRVGGKVKSVHLTGKAADIVVKGINPSLVYEYLDSKYSDQYGIGQYDSFTHVDVRDYRARW